MYSAFHAERATFHLYTADRLSARNTSIVEYILEFVHASGCTAAEVIPSFNFGTEASLAADVAIQASGPSGNSPWFDLGRWLSTRDAVNGCSSSSECDNGNWGHVETDIAVVTQEFTKLTLKIVAKSQLPAHHPVLKQAGLSVYCNSTDTRKHPCVLTGGNVKLQVPLRSQLEYADGRGWCSPTSCGMVLDYWATKLDMPALGVPTPTIAEHVCDALWNGTGNWAFNMAYIGNMPNMAAAAVRVQCTCALQRLLALQIPPVVSVSYDTLTGVTRSIDPGHLMVVTGVNEDGTVMLNDPYFDPTDPAKGRVAVSLATFDQAWQRSKRLVYIIAPQGLLIPALTAGLKDCNA